MNHKRLLIIVIGICFLFSILIFRFFQIQIIEGDKWEKVAKRQHFFSVEEPYVRGSFWSNTSIKRKHPEKPQRFVLDIQKFHLYIDPVSIPKEHRKDVADYFIETMDLQLEEGIRLRSQFEYRSRSRKLVAWLDRETKDRLLKWWQTYARKHKIARNAVYFVSEYQRSYPFGKLLGQILHTVQGHRDEITKQAHPTGGLEQYFHHYLKGKQGKRLLKRSPRHAFETGNVISTPENGADIYLTINHYLQAIAEEQIEKGVKRCHAKGGWAVMMDPKTGEILALAHYPFYYPMQYQEYYNDPEKIDITCAKAIQGAYEIGSVLKSITVSVALLANRELLARGELPLFDPEEKLPCADGRFPGRRKEISDVTLHRYLNMNMALQKSSNIYFARIVQRIIERLGNEWYRQVLEEVFGFGKKTGIEFPSESAGVLPRPGKLHPNGTLEWSVPTPFSLAMGHNMQVNSLQVVRAYAMLANGGYFVQPTLLRQIRNAEGAVILDQTKSKIFPQHLDPEIVAETVKAMKYTTKPGGCGRRADVWGYTEVAKTGSAHKIVDGAYSETQFFSSIVGFAPVSDPAFVLLVSIDEPERLYIPGVGRNHHGSVCAAPVFKEIASRTLEYLGVSPDDPHGYPYGDPRYDRELADWLPETRALQEKYEQWNN